MKKTITILKLFFLAGYIHAQDVHFSNWNQAPMLLNPATTGVFDGKLRFTNSYRSQWSGITKAYTTIHSSLDFPIAKPVLKERFFGGGIMVVQDRAGSGNFKTTLLQGSLSFTTAVDDGNNFFSVGFQGGLNQFAFDVTDATWDNQWNGDNFDPTLPSYENIQLTQFTYPDLNAGLLWHYVPDQQNYVYAGAALAHINSANASFYVEGKHPLNERITFHAGGMKSVGEEKVTWFAPSVLVMHQAGQLAAAAAFTLRNKVQFKSQYTNYRKEVYFDLRAMYRLKDAVSFSARFEYNNLFVGVGYDYTLSALQRQAGAGSAFEFSIGIFNPLKRGESKTNYSKLPKFL